jgi:hypothetical protein
MASEDEIAPSFHFTVRSTSERAPTFDFCLEVARLPFPLSLTAER